jgi:hypothetical protein
MIHRLIALLSRLLTALLKQGPLPRETRKLLVVLVTVAVIVLTMHATDVLLLAMLLRSLL